MVALIAGLALVAAVFLRPDRGGVAVTPVAPAPRAQPLKQRIDFAIGPGGQSQRRLAENVVHRYRFLLKAGELLHAFVEQDVKKDDAVDVLLTLYGPGGKLYEIDSPMRASGAEEIFVVAEAPGIYQVEIDGLGSEGTYLIRTLPFHRASDSERLNARAERIFYESRSLARLKPPKVEEALAGFQEAERLWRGLGKPARRAEAFRRCGALLFDQWQIKRALTFQQQALDLYRATGNHDMETAQLAAVGLSRKSLGDLEGAETIYRRAVQVAREYGFPNREANAFFNLAILLYQRGDSWDALDACDAAKILLRKSKKKEPFQDLDPFLLMGQVYVSLGKFQLGLSQYEKALKILGSSQSPAHRAEILSRISELYLSSGDFSRALTYARSAIEYRGQAGDSRGKAVSLAGMSLILQQTGDFTQARDLQEQALAIFHETGDLRSEGISHLNLGHLWIAQNDARAAMSHFEKAWVLARQQGLKEGEMTALYEMAQAERLRGNPIAARRRIDEALAILGSLSAGAPPDELKSLYLTARQKGYGLLIDLLVKSPAQYTPPGDILVSFETSERDRWQQLASSLTSTRLRAGILKRADPVLVAERLRLEDEINRIESKRLRLEGDGLPAVSAQHAQKGLMERLQTLDVRLRREDAWAANSDRPGPISLREAQQLLDSDSVLLEYHLGDTRSFLWLVTPSRVEVFTLPARNVIEDKARRLHGLLSESQWFANREKALPLARELSATLLGPIADRLGGGSIIIVPDGAIHLVPFALLPDPVRSSEIWKSGWPAPLIRSHRVSYLPSASVLGAIRRELAGRQLPAGRLAVLADPVFTDLPQLPLTRQEALAILSLIPPGQRTLRALGHQATRELAMSGRLGGYQIIHFATHATNHPEHPELSSIVLSQRDAQGRPREGHLRLQNIQDLDLPADLVVLSACKTALGKDVRGEGYMGLTQGFLYAGAARVLVSLWNVNERSTPAFMEHFYRLLVEGKSPDEALRRTQLWMAEAIPWSSPYYWAGFELHGEWR